MTERRVIDFYGMLNTLIVLAIGTFIGGVLAHGIQMTRIANALERAYPPKESPK